MLQNWLSPIKNPILTDESNYKSYQFRNCIKTYIDVIPNLEDCKIAIIGIEEEEANSVRAVLYQTNHAFEEKVIADLGNIRKKDHSFIIPVIEELLNSNIIPILIGQKVDYTYAQYQAYHSQKKLTNLILVDEKIRYPEDPDGISNHIESILETPRSHLFNMGIVGYQSHYTSSDILKYFDHRSFEYLRLGRIKSDIEEVEPLIRDADLLSFNIAAIKSADAPGQLLPSPSGFFSEEACQICRYAGMSDKLSSIGFYGFVDSLDRLNQTAHVVSQMVWYFIEGFFSRTNDYPIRTDGMIQYVVDWKSQEYQVTFLKSMRSGRWWMKIPIDSKEEKQRHELIPCSYNDYIQASKEDFPERLFNAYRRFID